MTRAANLTTQEAVLLSRQILLLRADVVGGGQKPSPGQWARDAEKHIGRVVTYAQMRAAAESLGFSKRDLWSAGQDDGGAAAEQCKQMIAHAELRMAEQIRAVAQKADGTDKRLGILHTHVQASDAEIGKLRNMIALLNDRIEIVGRWAKGLESKVVESREAVQGE